jgi:hypothetical protein
MITVGLWLGDRATTTSPRLPGQSGRTLRVATARDGSQHPQRPWHRACNPVAQRNMSSAEIPKRPRLAA